MRPVAERRIIFSPTGIDRNSSGTIPAEPRIVGVEAPLLYAVPDLVELGLLAALRLSMAEDDREPGVAARTSTALGSAVLYPSSCEKLLSTAVTAEPPNGVAIDGLDIVHCDETPEPQAFKISAFHLTNLPMISKREKARPAPSWGGPGAETQDV